MKDIIDLRQYLLLGKSLKVCVLDNNSIELLTRVKISPEKIFNQYDIILIPGWVWVEVSESDNRINYINSLKEYSNVQIINEFEYLILVDYKEALLYYLFRNCCENVSRLISFLKRDILKNRPIEDLEPYEEWLNIFYNEGLVYKGPIDKKIKRSNAGEISISVLSYIFSYFYSKHINTITIFSNDRDAYEYVTKAKEGLNKNEFFKDKRHIPITFKSNDFLIIDWVSCGYIDKENIDKFVQENRQARRMKFTRKKPDNSIEEQDCVIGNSTFLGMLKDITIHVIF